MANPGLIGRLWGGDWITKDALRAFHDALYAEYRIVMPGFKPTVFRMREYWAFWENMFDVPARHRKGIRKAICFADYECSV